MPGSFAVWLDIPAGPVLCLGPGWPESQGNYKGLDGGPNPPSNPGASTSNDELAEVPARVVGADIEE
jgi:hypothetical protein